MEVKEPINKVEREPREWCPPSLGRGGFSGRKEKWKWKPVSRVRLSATPWTIQPRNSPGQNTGVGSLSLLQGIFATQGLEPGLLHCRWIISQLSHRGSPRTLEWVTCPFSSRPSCDRNWAGVSCIAGGFFTSWATGEAFQQEGVFSYSKGCWAVKAGEDRKLTEEFGSLEITDALAKGITLKILPSSGLHIPILPRKTAYSNIFKCCHMVPLKFEQRWDIF